MGMLDLWARTEATPLGQSDWVAGMTWIYIAFGVPILLVAALIGAVILRVLWLRHREAHRFADAHNATIDGRLESGTPISKAEKYHLQVRWPGRLRQLPLAPYTPRPTRIR